MALTDQMMRAARLDTTLYEEVEQDTSQTNNAVLVVILGSLASGIAGAIKASEPGASGSAIGGLLGGLIVALLGFAVWTACVYWVGTMFLGGTATWGEVLRTVGFANSPGVLNILGVIPVIGGLIMFLIGIWTLVATVIAVRQSLDVGTGKAVVASVIGFILFMIVLAVVGTIFALPMALSGMG